MHWFVVSQQSAAVVHLSCVPEHVALTGALEQTSPPSSEASQNPLQH
jgi:hypothetical protein